MSIHSKSIKFYKYTFVPAPHLRFVKQADLYLSSIWGRGDILYHPIKTKNTSSSPPLADGKLALIG